MGPSGLPLVQLLLTVLLLLQLVQLLLLLVLLSALLQGLFLQCPASRGQAAAPLTRAALSVLSSAPFHQGFPLLSAQPWLDPTAGGALFPAAALRLPTPASLASLECPANPLSAWRPLSLPSSIERPGPQRRPSSIETTKTTQQEYHKLPVAIVATLKLQQPEDLQQCLNLHISKYRRINP